MKQIYTFKNIFLLIILGFLSLFTNQLFSQQSDQQENSIKHYKSKQKSTQLENDSTNKVSKKENFDSKSVINNSNKSDLKQASSNEELDQPEYSVEEKRKFLEDQINQNLVKIRSLLENEDKVEKFHKELLETIYIKAEHDIPNVNIKALLFDKKEFNVKNLNNKELIKANDFIDLVLEKIKKL